MKLSAESKIFLWILLGTAFFVGTAVWFFSKPAKPVVLSKETLIPNDAYTKGGQNASVYLVEFSDFQCPACAAFAPTVDLLTEKYKDQLLFAYRHFPLPQHEFAKPAAYVAEAGGQEGKFWETASFLFKNQKNFSEAFFASYPAPTKEIMEKVERDLRDAQKLNLKSTPSFFLNGVLLTNLYNTQDLVQAVEKAIQNK